VNAKTAIAKILKIEGIEFISGFPRNPILDPAAKEGIRFIKTRNERVAVNIADGYTRASFGKRLGVCAVQLGPGIENSFSGVAQAFSDSVPILVLPEGYSRRRQELPNFNSAQNFRGITKWSDSIRLADQVPDLMRRAFTYLRIGRPGPVLLEIPMDVAEEEFDDAKFHYNRVSEAKSQGDPEDVKKAAKALISAESPIIRAGSGILYACAWNELRELADLLQIPVLTTLSAKSAFPEDHPLSLGTGSRTRPKMLMHFLKKADLVFAIGSSCTKESFTTQIPDGKRIIQSTIDERDINKDYPVEIAIIGDAKLVLGQLIEEVKKQLGPNGKNRNNETAQLVKTVKEEWLKDWMPKLTSNEVPINPYRVIWDMMKALDRNNSIVTHDAGNPRDQIATFYESLTPGSYLGWGKSTTLGSSLGLAMGAKLARPEKTVVHFLGDAAFGQVGMDFETAVREKIPVLSILLNNSVLGGYRKQHPVTSEHYGLHRISGNYAKIAEGLGVHAERVDHPNEIIPAILRARKVTESGQPAMIEIITKEQEEFSLYE
jgi:thiamine pyrophosphate-dependent acetolactate synthase large subunit-like protein